MWFSRKYHHDIFLSHAVEDKPFIADELSRRLKEKGLKVWYSGDELAGGVDLYRVIEKAIDQSRFGVVVFSKTFIDKTWTRKELSWLEKKETGGMRVILPVLHEMTMEELKEFDIHIASKVCIHASHGMEIVVKKVHDEIEKEKKKKKKRIIRQVAWSAVSALMLLAIIFFISFQIYNHKPNDNQIESAINGRIEECVSTIDTKYIRPFSNTRLAIKQSQIDSLWQRFDAVKSYYRNEYEFNNCKSSFTGRKRIEGILGVNLVDMADLPGYGFNSHDAWWSNRTTNGGWHNEGFSLSSKQPIQFSWAGKKDESGYVVKVDYTNNIRFINVSLSVPPTASGTKRHEMMMVGFLPTETYYFEEGSDGEWYLMKVE